MTRLFSVFTVVLFVFFACSSSNSDPLTQKQDTSRAGDSVAIPDTTRQPDVADTTVSDPDTKTPDDLPDQKTEEDICVPDCGDKQCGDDGCGGECGTCDDGIDCTEPLCNEGTCEFVLKTDFCFIDDACFQSGDQHPDDACQWCAPGISSEAWSPAPDGDPCDEGWVCYQGTCCNKAANCEGKGCGDDGCGGICDPGCKDYFMCLEGACSPTYAWGFSAIGSANEVCRDIAFDADGNVYMIASFDSLDVKIGIQKMTKDTTYEDLFLARFTPDGELDWWQSFAKGEVVQFPKEMRIATDGLGRVAVAGGIMAWETGGFEFGQGLVQTGGDNNGFVGVFDNTGALVWSYYVEADNGDSVSLRVLQVMKGHGHFGQFFQGEDLHSSGLGKEAIPDVILAGKRARVGCNGPGSEFRQSRLPEHDRFGSVDLPYLPEQSGAIFDPLKIHTDDLGAGINSPHGSAFP